MSATIRSDGTVVRPTAVEERLAVITAEDAGDPEKVARQLNAIRERVLDLLESSPRSWVEYEDVVVTSGSEVILQHNLGGRVRWSIIDWLSDVTGSPPILEESGGSDANTLILDCSETGTATLRVWRAD